MGNGKSASECCVRFLVAQTCSLKGVSQSLVSGHRCSLWFFRDINTGLVASVSSMDGLFLTITKALIRRP